MIRQIENKPEILEYVKDDFVYFELLDEKGLYGYMALRRLEDRADIHMEIIRWSHNVLKHMKTSWLPEFKRMCRINGVKEVVGRQGGQDKKFGKFAQYLGFCKPEFVQMTRMEI